MSSNSALSRQRPWPSVDVIIPVFNESESIWRVLADLPRQRLRRILVVDNGSSDGSAVVAARAGASVIHEPRRGYGSACLAGIAELARQSTPPGLVVFLDGDYSDHPDELPQLVQPIVDDDADLVVGSRVLGRRERGALLPQARFGNWLASRMIRALYGLTVTDLGPFRAVRWSSLLALEMSDPDFGWTAEMQVKAARSHLRYREVPVSYRRRIGMSKISGTLSGSLRAGWKIISTIVGQRGRYGSRS